MKYFIICLMLLLWPLRAFCETETAEASKVSGDLAILSGKNYKVYYNKGLVSKLLNCEMKPGDDWPYSIHRLFQIRLSANDPREYTVDFDPGPSADYCFAFSRMKDGKDVAIGVVNGIEMSIPGDGYVYVNGHVNNMFDLHSKYTIAEDKLVEIEQPFYYVGSESEALDDLIMFKEIIPDIKNPHDITVDINNTLVVNEEKLEAKKVERVIRKGEKLFVVCCKHIASRWGDTESYDWYLIRDEHGITGWVAVMGYAESATEIKGLFYAGD